MTYVPTTQQKGDILTKGLSRQSFENLVDKLGMIDIIHQLEGECQKIMFFS